MMKPTCLFVLATLLLQGTQGCSSRPSSDLPPGSIALNEDMDWVGRQIVLNNARSIVLGPFGDLFVADTGNSRVLRVRCEGIIKEQIGRPGAGPGEFGRPWDIFIDPENKILSVSDRSDLARITQYEVTDSHTRFVRTLHIPQIVGGSIATGLVGTASGGFLISPRLTEFRIFEYDSEGNVIRAFGEQWIPTGVSYSRLWAFNAMDIYPLGKNDLIAIHLLRPRIEIWSVGGYVRKAISPDLPEIRNLEPIGDGGESAPVYTRGAFVGPGSECLYWAPYVDQRDVFVVYEIDVKDLEPKRRFEARRVVPDIAPQAFVVVQTADVLEFILIDRNTDGLRKFRMATHGPGIIVPGR